MDREEMKMLETLEQARKASEEPNPFPVYAYSNGHEIRWYRSYNVNAVKALLEKNGFWLCSIFENGYRAEA